MYGNNLVPLFCLATVVNTNTTQTQPPRSSLTISSNVQTLTFHSVGDLKTSNVVVMRLCGMRDVDDALCGLVSEVVLELSV
jgi:hypothetical protein